MKALLDDDPETRRTQTPVRPAGSRRPTVLFCMAHAGFFRHFQRLVARLRHDGIDVHLVFMRPHKTIAMSDYEAPAEAGAGALTETTLGRDVEKDAPVRLRLLRDLVHYAGPDFADAPNLVRRFLETQGNRLSTVPKARRGHAILRTLPRFVRTRLDTALARADAGRPPAKDAVDIVDEIRPDLVLLTPMIDFVAAELEVAKAAIARGVPTVMTTASWDNLTSKGRLKILPGHVSVWNEDMAAEAVRLHDVPRDRIWVVGASVFDDWFDMQPKRTRPEFCDLLGLPADRPILLYVCSSDSIAGQGEPGIVRDWIQAVRASADARVAGASLLVRPHPMASAVWADALGTTAPGDVGTFHGATVWPVSPKHPAAGSSRSDFFDSLWHADAIIGLNTSVMVEASILRKPVLTFTRHGAALTQTGNIHFRHLATAGFVVNSPDLSAHVKALGETLASPGRVAADADAFVSRFIRPVDRALAASDALALRIEALLDFPPQQHAQSGS